MLKHSPKENLLSLQNCLLKQRFFLLKRENKIIHYKNALLLRDVIALINKRLYHTEPTRIYTSFVNLLHVLASAVHILKLERYRED